MPKKYTLRRKGADKHLLYQWAVQDVDHEIDFTVRQYKKRRGRAPRVLREDFCGTALMASRWVKGHPKRRAIALDLDGATLDWGREHNLKPLGKDRKRVDLRQSDVRTVTTPEADVVQAYNFSYCLLHPLSELIKYFRAVRRSLATGGIFLLDCHGGWDCQEPNKDRRTVESPQGRFGFVFEQADFNPIDSHSRCHIHFEFAKGKRWKKAFSYDFRIYSLAEVHDALSAAGFTNIEVLWDFEEDEDAEPDYRVATHVENCPSWLAYLVADAEPTKHRKKG